MKLPRFALALSIVACSSTSSTGVPTNHFKPFFDVDVDTVGKGSTYVGVIFDQPGTLTQVRLEGGDSVTFKTDKDPSLPLGYDSGLQVYNNTIKDVTDRTFVTIMLTRSSGTSAPSSTVQLPAALALTAPMPSAQVTYGAGSGKLVVTWTNIIAGATVDFSPSPCGGAAVSTKPLSGPDNGSFTLGASDLLVSAPPAAGSCVSIRMTRHVNGTIDPAYSQDGTFTARREDYVQVNVVP